MARYPDSDMRCASDMVERRTHLDTTLQFPSEPMLRSRMTWTSDTRLRKHILWSVNNDNTMKKP